MLNLCQNCKRPIEEGERVKVMVEATYHRLKSAVAYALDKGDMIADPDTLYHAEDKDCE